MLERVEADPAKLPGGIVAELYATKACAASWKVMAMRRGSTQTEMAYSEMFKRSAPVLRFEAGSLARRRYRGTVS